MENYQCDVVVIATTKL